MQTYISQSTSSSIFLHTQNISGKLLNFTEVKIQNRQLFLLFFYYRYHVRVGYYFNYLRIFSELFLSNRILWCIALSNLFRKMMSKTSPCSLSIWVISFILCDAFIDIKVLSGCSYAPIFMTVGILGHQLKSACKPKWHGRSRAHYIYAWSWWLT